MDQDEILFFERAFTPSGHILVPRTSLNMKTLAALTEQERKDMIACLEDAKEIFRAKGVSGSPPALGAGDLVSSNLTCPTKPK